MTRFKNKALLAGLAVLAFSCSQNQAQKEAEFYVRGNCGMCEERIEQAALELDGVSRADWKTETKSLSVSYDSTKIDEMKIQQAVANVGHETKSVASPQEVHDELPECCKKGGSM